MQKCRQLLVFTAALATGFMSSPWVPTARADRCADVYLIQNTLWANQRSQEREKFQLAEVGRRIDPEDEVYVGNPDSIGALLFDELSLVRVSGTSFTKAEPFSFERDTTIDDIFARAGSFDGRDEIQHYLTLAQAGKVLVMLPSNGGHSIIKTNQAIIEVKMDSNDDYTIIDSPELNESLRSRIICESSTEVSSKGLLSFETSILQPQLSVNYDNQNNTQSAILLGQSQLEAEREVLSRFEEFGQAVALFVSHDSESNTTSVFALTGDSQIQVSNLANINLPNRERQASLSGGQTVEVSSGRVGDIQEFDIEEFLANNPIAYGLPLNQAGTATPGSAQVNQELRTSALSTIGSTRNSIRIAIANQARRLRGFRANFLRDAMGGDLSRDDFNGHGHDEVFGGHMQPPPTGPR